MIQQARVLLAEIIHEFDPTWTTTVETKPKLTATLTVQVGHVLPSLGTFRSSRFDVPLTWWANEGNSAEAVDDLYAALSWEDGANSIVQRLAALSWVDGVNNLTAPGERIEGPTGYTAAESVVRVLGDNLPGGS